MTKAEMKALALSAYSRAPESGKWEQAATLLKQAFVPKPRTPKVRKFRKGKCIYPFPTVVATFNDGHKVKMAFWSEIGLPLDWNRAKSVCKSAYANRHNQDAPHIASLIEINSGESPAMAAE